MSYQYNRQPQNKMYPLSQRGYKQAQRNNSHQIWTLFSWTTQDDDKKMDQTLHTNDEAARTARSKIAEKQAQQKQFNKQEDRKDNEQSFKLTKNQQEKVQQPQNKFKRSLNKSKKPEKSRRISVQEKPVLTKQQIQLQKIKRKSIQKYIRQQIPYTRTLSNSAFKLFYQRPCPQAYGNKNVSTLGGAFYGNFMKTHNIQPHTLDNRPQFYQTFTSALNFGKRTKLDLQDRWKKIQRQLAKNLDFRQLVNEKAAGYIQLDQNNKQEILKQNINAYGQQHGKQYAQKVEKQNVLSKTSKSLDKLAVTRDTYRDSLKISSKSAQKQRRQPSQHNKGLSSSNKQLYYVYKIQEGDQNYSYTRYARDRHGITCYVDPSFKQNQEAYTNFLKKIKPVYPEKCKPEDMNIDSIRLKNYQINKQQDYPQHYLIPNTEEPYNPKSYSRKRKSSVMQQKI